MLNAFGADQSIRDFLDCAGFSLDYQNLQAVIVIQMHVHGGEDVVKVGVLKIGQLFIEQTHMMIVDQSNGADDGGVWTFPHFFDQLVADQVAKGL